MIDLYSDLPYDVSVKLSADHDKLLKDYPANRADPDAVKLWMRALYLQQKSRIVHARIMRLLE